VRYVPLVIILAAMASLSAPADAAEGPFGLGIILGEPTGLSAKVWLNGRMAIDGAGAWSFTDQAALHLHADYLVHFFNRLDVDRGSLPLYVGIGGRVKFLDEDDLVGIRVPLGAAYLLEGVPVDIFFEVVPLMDVAPETEFRMNAAIGFRYFFGRE
jgi:hypothetical protein